MKRSLILVLVMILLSITSSALLAETGFEGRPILNNLSNPTGYTLNQKEFTVGIGSIGFGITDNVQVGTNILLYALQIYNANLKVNFLETPTTAVASGISWHRFRWDVDDSEVSFTSISPYIALTQQVVENTNIHIGGKYSYFDSKADVDDVEEDGLTSGTTVFTGLEYSLSNKTKFLAEADYDMTFDGFRAGGGVLFGWKTFRLKLGVKYYNNSGDSKNFVFPVVGLWWRFWG
jgi:hypothetical protein